MTVTVFRVEGSVRTKTVQTAAEPSAAVTVYSTGVKPLR
jgi:hypothetical protein